MKFSTDRIQMISSMDFLELCIINFDYWYTEYKTKLIFTYFN